MSITSTAHAPASTSSRSGTRRVLRHGALAGVLALPVIEAYAALAKAAGIPLKPGSPERTPQPWSPPVVSPPGS